MTTTDRKFDVGDKVRWISSAVGKTGEVIGIVPPKNSARQCAYDLGFYLDNTGIPRDHESYIVRGRKNGSIQEDADLLAGRVSFAQKLMITKTEARRGEKQTRT